MNVIIKCSKCGEELAVKNVSASALNESIIEVSICKDTGCYDCSNCEDLKNQIKQIADLKKQVRRLQDRLR